MAYRPTAPIQTLSRICYYYGLKFERLRAELIRCGAVQKFAFDTRTVTLTATTNGQYAVVSTDSATGDRLAETFDYLALAQSRFTAHIANAAAYFAITGAGDRRLAVFGSKERARNALQHYKAMLPGEKVKVLRFRAI